MPFSRSHFTLMHALHCKQKNRQAVQRISYTAVTAYTK